MGYRRTGTAADPVVNQELDRVALSMSQPMDYIALRTLYAAPGRIFDGMTVLADGTSWNPGGGAGVYTYYGAAWNKLG